jgi:hypothetical protein
MLEVSVYLITGLLVASTIGFLFAGERALMVALREKRMRQESTTRTPEPERDLAALIRLFRQAQPGSTEDLSAVQRPVRKIGSISDPRHQAGQRQLLPSISLSYRSAPRLIELGKGILKQR